MTFLLARFIPMAITLTLNAVHCFTTGVLCYAIFANLHAVLYIAVETEYVYFLKWVLGGCYNVRYL
jgi:hypothetical protein